MAGDGSKQTGQHCHPKRKAGAQDHRLTISPLALSIGLLPTRERRPLLFKEGVEVLFKAFEGKPFSHQSKYYTIPPEVPYRGYTLKEITLVPAPERLPVECWQPIQSGSERAFEFMAKHGINGVIGGGSAEGGAVERHMLGFQAAYAARRRARTRRAAGAWLSVPHRVLPRAGDPRGRAALRREHENFRRVTPRVGIDRRADRVICATPLGTPLDVQLQDLDRFAKEVIPAFRNTRTLPRR